MVIEIAAEALQIMLQKEDAEELRIRVLHRDKPWCDDGQVDRNSDGPQRAQQKPRIATQSGEDDDDSSCEENCDWPFRQRCQPAEEVEP